ncbi:hypothetical protein MRX96_053988, partial [Rhipicephalus microplus]
MVIAESARPPSPSMRMVTESSRHPSPSVYVVNEEARSSSFCIVRSKAHLVTPPPSTWETSVAEALRSRGPLKRMSGAKPNVVFVLGPPGSGKGTQCQKLVE